MTDATNPTTCPNNPSTTAAVPARRYRPRVETARDRRLTPRFTEAELSGIRAAATAAQMTVTGFSAFAVLAVAGRRQDAVGQTGDAPAGVQELAELQRELFAARTAVNRTGVNLNQAVTELNSTGEPPVWLRHAVNRVTLAVAEIDTVVARIHRRLP